jgi:hypothetical protein
MRVGRSEALDIFNKWLTEQTLLRCALSFLELAAKEWLLIEWPAGESEALLKLFSNTVARRTGVLFCGQSRFSRFPDGSTFPNADNVP